jgi:hypothetical protein
MADYFLLLDAVSFEGRTRPALAAAWRQRHFEPCRPLCTDLLSAARDYAERYHVGSEEPLLRRVADGLPFDRACWRALVAEMLLYTAVEIPEFQTCEDTLCRLLAPDHYHSCVEERERFAAIQQAHRGTRDLTFGAAAYRPENAGYNNAADVARLADRLATVRPELWKPGDLAGLRGAEDEAEREEELAFAQEWFPAIAEVFRRAHQRGWVIVHERIF